MADRNEYALTADRRGLVWDLLLYVPTVLALASIALKLSYGPNASWAYLLAFMASFFLFTGANRILGGRLMLLPNSPVALGVDKRRVQLTLRSGERVDLVKELRYFPDYAGKSFGLAGFDLSGRRRQFVIHRGQFADESHFQGARALLAVYK